MDCSGMANPVHRGAAFSPPRDLRSPPMSPREPPACVQNAMMTKDKKPFTYTPGGLDLSQIRSEKMARRLMINAMSPGVQEKPKPPSFTQSLDSPTPRIPVNYYNLPIAVFPQIQLPANPKELLRRTSGPYNRSESIDRSINDNNTKECEKKEEDSPKEEKKEIVQNCSNKEKSPVIETGETLSIKDRIEKLLTKEKSDTPIKETREEIKPQEEIKNESQEKVNGDIIEQEIVKQNNDFINMRSPTPIIQNVVNGEIKSVKPDDSISNSIPNKTLNLQEPESRSVSASPYRNSETCESTDSNEIEFDDDNTHNKMNPESNEEKIEQIEEVNEGPETPLVTECPEIFSLDRADEDGDVTPKVDVINHRSESTLFEVNNSENIAIPESCEKPTECLAHNIENIRLSVSPTPFVKKDSENGVVVRRENSDAINSRRNSENIKSLNIDLDSVPSLNLCSKRFSFLRESPPKDDPYAIVTGVPPKISLLGNDRKPVDVPKNEILPPWKTKLDDIPPTANYGNNPLEKKEPPDFTWKSQKLDPVQPVNYNVTPQLNTHNDLWSNSAWSKPKEFGTIPSPSNNFLEDSEPAWKKELREIANQKRQSQEESAFYKEEIEPPWRRELRELSQSKLSKDTSYSSNYENNPSWNNTLNDKNNNISFGENPSSLSNPIWSQTLRPKTWRERKADLAREKEVEIPEWKKAVDLRRNFVNSFINKSTSSSSSCSSPAREIRKTPEIMVEIAGQPTSVQATPASNNGYTYPWESSSESSAAFSPEPYLFDRTPTPQSRNSPYRQPSQYLYYDDAMSPVIPREYGTLSYQPNRRHQIRSFPIQSRSFKYLQRLTGTIDAYEDDEPFIPQPPQHSHLKPDV